MYEHNIINISDQDGKDDVESQKKKGRSFANKQYAKNKRYTIRLDDEEHKDWQEKANKRNMSISDYLRYLVKKDK